MKFFLALLASQQTLAESGVDGSCVAEEVSLLQSRHSAAKENETVQVTFYLSAPGAPECVVGESVSEEQCNDAVKNLAPSTQPYVRGLQVGSGGRCLDEAWGQVPNGCSAQSGGDWAAHFKTGSPQPSECINPIYRLVCTARQQLYWAPYGQKKCKNGGDTVSALACAFAVNYMYGMGPGNSMSPLVYRGKNKESCAGNGWGQVPHGCSARNGDNNGGYGDGTPHFKLGGGPQCAGDKYQLLCTTHQGSCIRCYD